MRNRYIGLLCALAATAVVSVAFAQNQAPGTGQARAAVSAKPEMGPPPYTYTAKYYGFVSCNTQARRGRNITPDEIRSCVAAGGKYILLGSPEGRRDIEPAEKAAPFAGQQVFMTLSVTTQRYGSGPTSDPSIEGYPAGGDRPMPRRDTYKIISVTPTEYNDAWANWKRPEGAVNSDGQRDPY